MTFSITIIINNNDEPCVLFKNKRSSVEKIMKNRKMIYK